MKKVVIAIAVSVLSLNATADLIQKPVSHATMVSFATMPVQKLAAAAKRGEAAAQFYLATRYKQGKGVAQNQNQAFAWYKKAADQGVPAALLNVGQMYVEGVGVAKNVSQGQKYLEMAAKRGDNRASYNLALIDERNKNYASAYKWYEVSSREGMLDYKVRDMSEGKILQLASTLSPNDIRSARQDAYRWLQQQ